MAGPVGGGSTQHNLDFRYHHCGNGSEEFGGQSSRANVFHRRSRADGHGDTVYLFTSHDEDDARGFPHARLEVLFARKDMVNWTDHGAIASLATFKWAEQNNDAWAPQCVERDGKFYLYVPISVQGWPKNVIAVAVADNPLGPVQGCAGKSADRQGQSATSIPPLYVDDDGQAYLYFGNPNRLVRQTQQGHDFLFRRDHEGRRQAEELSGRPLDL